MTLFVYGSLMSRPELSRVLGRTYEGTYRAHKLSGFRRAWNAPDGDIAYLDLFEDADASVTGFLIELSDADLQRLDEWEPGYRRVTLDGFQLYLSERRQTKRGSSVLRSYLQLVQSAAIDSLPDLPAYLTIVEDA